MVAAQIPLTSFTDDVATLRKVPLRQEGSLVLVGHSYGGAVITAADARNPQVKALVYIAAVVPDASRAETALMAATQKPISVSCLGEPMGKPAWKEKPS